MSHASRKNTENSVEIFYWNSEWEKGGDKGINETLSQSLNNSKYFSFRVLEEHNSTLIFI